nr:PREDICTED: inner centromere protein A-like [Megachile rotundata]
MGTRSKDRIKAMISKDISDIHNRCMEVKKSINDNLDETLDYLRALIAQIPQSTSGPLIAKTPKVLRKRGMQRIETIPENEIIDITNVTSDFTTTDIKGENKDSHVEHAEELMHGRTKRVASKKAADNIKKQQSMSLSSKLRRPSSIFDNNDVKKKKRESRAKRKKSTVSSSDEESTKAPAKITKVEETILVESVPEKVVNTNVEKNPSTEENTIQTENRVKQENIESSKRSSMTTRSSSRKRTFSQTQNQKSKKSDIADDTVIAPTTNEIEEPSMYEDAIEKPMPIMNSTMNFNSTYTLQKMINATVVLEPLSAIKLNETVTVNKKISNSTGEKTVQSNGKSKSPRLPSKTLLVRLDQIKDALVNKEFDELLTEDESSPEIKKPRQNTKYQKKILKSNVSSEDEILNTPMKPTLKELNAGPAFQEIKNTYKSNALFSPYAKESVKKRVEAFEQVGMNSPKPTADVDVPTRVTRTKTRAQAAQAAQAEITEDTKTTEKTIAHKLARKSLAKAKKISLAKQVKDTDEYKENKVQAKSKTLLEKVNYKPQKTTPLTKTKIQLPSSVSRIPQTPNNQPNHVKALSATRTNIITSMDSFLQSSKPVNTRSSTDKTEDKRRKPNDDDARKKREETLRLVTEEKRRKRQEKELKNKLAREAKEKQDMEKRQKAEREREEKARLAQQMMEKQREEMEKKRLAQLQRAQEKEEKRRQEEQLRLQRLQEQEEAERILAEQRRREQEAEKRKEAEARSQQQTAAEAMKVKNQIVTQSKYGHKYHGPTNYILDSEPDEDESDDESKPKHVIPYWAHPQVRKAQLAMQRYIPDKAIFAFFGSRKCTPDLAEIFQGIDKSRLKRTSSAIWRTPPRFSMIGSERV